MRLIKSPLFPLFIPIILILLLSACSGAAPASELPADTMIVYKQASCGCCSEWTAYLEDFGMNIEVHETLDMASIKDLNGVPRELRSCHTAILNGYVIEGHVPYAEIMRLLEERPEIAGLAVAGMPVGSPGMEVEGVEAQAYDVIAFDKLGGTTVFASYPK